MMGIHYGVRPNGNSNFTYSSIGIVAYYDIGNTSSYPGSGTVVTDLSGNSYTGTLTNGPTYNSDYGGSIVFDASDDVITTTFSALQTDISGSFSYDAWVLPTASANLPSQSGSGISIISGNRWVINSDQRGEARGVGLSIGSNGICVGEHGNGNIYGTLVHGYSFSQSLFTHVSVVIANGSPSLYINGSFIKTGVTSGRTVYACFNSIGSGSYGIYSGRIAILKLYNYALTANQVSGNFNSVKSRFGVT
jgi:hypothetical protein